MITQEKMPKRFKNKMVIISIFIIGMMVIFSFLAPILSPNDPNEVDLTNKLLEPSKSFPLGTDHLGRCILSRLLYGTKVSLGTAVITMVITIIISVMVGTFSGYKGGYIDSIIMRLCDMILAFPSLVLTLVIIGMLGPGLKNLMIAMIAVQWVWYARMIRGMVLSFKEKNFILSAKVSGSSDFKIIFEHILPNVLPQIIVLATLDLGKVILHISGFSFLGLGVQPPDPEWGAMLNDGRQFIRSNPSLMMYPGMMILMTVISFNLIGDALRDVLEEKNY
ncbi:nickel ABC transporter permease subunit NikC [Clostridium formicaceticum]|uniref:Nickel ABC transporter permease subunit NikC n=1 Tax=Clostridium formicaceticum TaxID=1497 RepID=A0AAC9RR42_9CLOT|nr:nickel ABC transporter permease subunit NikC [Clostridium formicaceticum]AOY74926.1 nickel ABC transporter permease subunit NikC [Clostridium formicaceticum]ARE89333.1 Nickel transport system permease protein NikC [Clostridium formicaceticum]